MASYWDKFSSERLHRRRLLKTGAAFSIGAASLALIGCGSDDDDNGGGNGGTGSTPSAGASPTAASAGEPRRGGIFGSTFATLGNYNTVAFYHDGYNNSGITVYDRPITVDLNNPDGYVLQAMESIEIAEPTRVVMKLVPGMTYHNQEPANGRPVVAADIVATQQYVRELPNAENSNFQRNFLDRIEAPDDNTVVLHLVRPAAYLFSTRFLANPTGQPIIPQELLENLDDHPAVGSGPFELESHTFGAEYHYKRFENWRGASKNQPYFDGRVIYSITDTIAEETAFRGERTHKWEQVPAATVARLRNELDPDRFKLLEYEQLGIWGSNFNMSENDGPKPWHDIRVRQAIYRLTNRQQIADLVFDGQAVLTTGPIHASLPAYQLDASATEKYFVEDVEEAKKLLEAANYDTSQEWEDTNSNTNNTNAQAGEVWQQQLARGGFNIRVVPRPLAEILPNMLSVGKYDMWLGNQPGGDTPDRAMRNQHSDTGDLFNNCGLFDPEIDALIEKSEETVDREENIRLVKEIQQRCLDAYSLSYVMFTLKGFDYINGRVQDYFLDPVRGMGYQTQAWFSA